MTQRLQKFIFFVLLTFFLCSNVNQIFFIHTHSVDGFMVVHAHPFQEKEHKHANNEYIAIAYFNHQYIIKTEISFLEDVVYPYLYSVENLSFFSLYKEFHLQTFCRRGPPVV